MSYRTTKRSARYQGMKSKLGRGAMTKHRAYARAPQRSYVPRTLGPFSVSESKYFDTEVSAAAVAESTDWSGTSLSAGTIALPIEGSDIDNRIGRKIAIYKLVIRGVIRTIATATDAQASAAPAVRLILFVDTQTNGVAATGPNLMQAPTTATIAAAFSSLQNTANFGRFRVLRDVSIRPGQSTAFNSAATTGTQALADVPFKLSYRFKKPLVVRFNATNAGIIGDVVDNSIHLLGQKSEQLYTTNITYRTRIYYKDN